MQRECSLTFGLKEVNPASSSLFYTANGDKFALAKTIVSAGSAFVIGAPMILIGFSWAQVYKWNAAFDIVRDGEFLLRTYTSGRSGIGPIGSPQFFDVGSIIQIKEAGVPNTAPILGCVITLFFQPFSIELERPITDVGLNIIPFGGKNVTTNFSLLRYNGSTETPVNTNVLDRGTMFVVPADMKLLSVSFSSSLDIGKRSSIHLLKNGEDVWQAEFFMTPTGVDRFQWPESFPYKNLRAGDVLQLRYHYLNGSTWSPPGSCVLTLYTHTL